MNASLRRLVLAAAVAAPAAAWAAFGVPPGGAASYLPLRLPGLRLSMEYPSGWLLDDSDAETLHLVQLYGPWLRNVDHPVLTVFYYAPGSSFASKESYALKRLAPVSGSWDDRRTVTQGAVLLHGAPARTYTEDYVDTFGAFESPHREPVREKDVLVDAPQGGFYVFRYRAAKAIYDSYYAAFQRLLASAKAP